MTFGSCSLAAERVHSAENGQASEEGLDERVGVASLDHVTATCGFQAKKKRMPNSLETYHTPTQPSSARTTYACNMRHR